MSARIPKKLRVATLPKLTIRCRACPAIPSPCLHTYIGDASDVAEGGEVAIEKMTTSTRKATIKKGHEGHRPDRRGRAVRLR